MGHTQIFLVSPFSAGGIQYQGLDGEKDGGATSTTDGRRCTAIVDSEAQDGTEFIIRRDAVMFPKSGRPGDLEGPCRGLET